MKSQGGGAVLSRVLAGRSSRKPTNKGTDMGNSHHIILSRARDPIDLL